MAARKGSAPSASTSKRRGKATSSVSKGSSKRADSSAKAPPKKRRASAAEEKKDVCFVISPFGGWHDDYHREIFCGAIKAAGLAPARADDLFRSSNIVHDIWHLVASSRVMLADLTGKNPNVFYELGLAHAARKPVLLLTQSMDDVPFDLRALRVITYDVEHPSWGEVLRDSIKQGLKEMLESPERSVLPTFLSEEPTKQSKASDVSEEDRRFHGLQQQVASLRSEIRSSRQLDPDEIGPEEARARMAAWADDGLPRAVILQRLHSLGVPQAWAKKELSRVMRRSAVQMA